MIKPEARKTLYESPVRLSIILAVSIFIAETAVMIIVSIMPPLSVKTEAIIDSSLLMCFIIPQLYFFVLRPLIFQINERKHAETSLQKLNINLEQLVNERTRELKQTDEELQKFIYIASHDLQEPLRKIRTFGDRLKTRFTEPMDERSHHYLERMDREVDRMQGLIYDLRIFSSISSKAQPFVPVDLGSVVLEVVSDLEEKIKQSGGKVEIGQLPKIDADPLQMHQLFQNLIGNALKFAKKNEDPVIKVHGMFSNRNGAEAENDYYQLTVEDNGIGFDEKYAERIFGVFQRLHDKSEYEGTGIGLSVCKKIVERHGGSITAKSEPGEGAKFIITLPVKQINGESTNG